MSHTFHIVGMDVRGGIVLRQKWSRSQVEARLANMPTCLRREPRGSRPERCSRAIWCA
jgi:hypothetical protein